VIHGPRDRITLQLLRVWTWSAGRTEWNDLPLSAFQSPYDYTRRARHVQAPIKSFTQVIDVWFWNRLDGKRVVRLARTQGVQRPANGDARGQQDDFSQNVKDLG
jgi:hypothetical protein